MTNDSRTLVKTRELRTKLPEYLARVKAGERLVVERHSEAVAALVPLADYWRLHHDRVRARFGKDSMNTQRIVVTNVSGGEGKTTTAREVAYALASRGYRVGLVDLDPQASLTKSLGLHDPQEDGTPPTALLEDAPALSVFARDGTMLPSPTSVYGVDVWPANASLGGADALLATDPSRLHNLRDALDALTGYDFLFLDTKPSLSHLLYASVAAADHLVVPVNGIKGMENLEELGKLLKLARPVSPRIGVRLFVPNRIRPTSTITRTSWRRCSSTRLSRQ